MRLIEVILILGLFTGNIAELSRISMKLLENEKKINAVKTKTEMNVFISESFRQSCVGKGFGSPDKWKENCRVLFNLDSIEWELTSGDCMYMGTWEGEYGIEEAYCFVSK